MAHEPVDQFLRRGFRSARFGNFIHAMHHGDQNGYRLSEVEHREVGIGRHSNHEIATIEVLPIEAAGFVSEDQGNTRETAIDEILHGLAWRQHRQVPPTTAGSRGSQCVVVSCRFLEAFPSAAFDTIFCAARPTTNLRIVRLDCRPHKFNALDPEIRRDPQGSTDISGQRRFNENEPTHRHWPI